MDEGDALIGVAEIAVAIAGFSGIAAAIRHRGAERWPLRDRDRFVDLVAHSGIALFASLLPLVFAHRFGPGPDLWSTSSLLWAAFASVGIGLGLARNRTRARRRWGGAWGVAVTLVFAALVVLQVYNGIRLREFWPYLAGLVANLGFAFVQFMWLAVPRPAREP